MPNPMDAILSRISEGNRRRQENALNEIFAKSYEPGAAVPFVDEGAQAFGLLQEPGMVAGYKPGRINPQNALAQMAQSKEPGFALKAFAMQEKMDAARAEQQKPIEQLKMEYALKDALQTGQMDRAKDLFQQLKSGSSGGGFGTKLEIGPQGATVSFDPSTDASTRLDMEKANLEKDKFSWETGGNSGNTRTSGAIPPKSVADANTVRLKALQESASSRRGSLDTAEKFLSMFENKKMNSGAVRKAAEFIPGVYTKQGQLDEEFNAFAETAARQALKASGEQRPTDADVKGMKAAMFGTGRDEETNKVLLKNYIEQQLKDENTYRELTGQPYRQPLEYAGVTDVTNAPKDKVTKPKAGVIDNGYVFMGGDPADQANWKKSR